MKPRPQLIAFRYGNPCHSADLPAGQPADEKNSVHSRPGQCLTVTIVGACFNAEFSQRQIKHDFRNPSVSPTIHVLSHTVNPQSGQTDAIVRQTVAK